MPRILTGITTSGTPHLGNYVGAIRPAIAESRAPGVESFYFLADYHALIKVAEPARVQRSTLEIAAAWLACGLDPERVWFYRQSDIPEIPELTWLLTCVAAKGLLNRAHAYKAAVDRNVETGDDPDAGVTAGLFMYPVLMAADILLFNANQVPVGRDQIQHIEMARDIGARFNHLYGEHFVLPEAAIEEHVATLPGLDGRKMSKSYDNTIPLFCQRGELKKLIAGIVTDSRAPGEAKDADNSNVFQLYQAFASAEEAVAMRQAFAEGIGWGDAKQKLFERIDAEIAPLRERYEDLMLRRERIEEQLRHGAEKARVLAKPLLAKLREAVGLRDLSGPMTAFAEGKAEMRFEAKGTLTGIGSLSGATALKFDAKATLTKLPQFKQYRESDGQFYFKLIDGDGRVLLQSTGFASPKDAGAVIAALKKQADALARNAERIHAVDGVDDSAIADALSALRDAD
jgi:tryptophanyl-tRNA synthetase